MHDNMSRSFSVIAWGAAMSDRKLFGGTSFDPETIDIMGQALAGAFTALGITDKPDNLKILLAKVIIDLARAGERNPERLKATALKSMRQ
jgi:hypothetical protein